MLTTSFKGGTTHDSWHITNLLQKLYGMKTLNYSEDQYLICTWYVFLSSNAHSSLVTFFVIKSQSCAT